MFASHLTFHGVNIAVTGKAAEGVAGDPFADSEDEANGNRASLVKEIAFDDDGNLVLHLEDLKEGRIVLSAPKFNAGVSGSKATPKALAEPKIEPSTVVEASSQVSSEESHPPATVTMATKVSPDEDARKPDSLKRSRGGESHNDDKDSTDAIAYTPDSAASSSSNVAEWSSVDDGQQRKNRHRMPWDDDDDDDPSPDDNDKENAAVGAASGRVETKRGRITSPSPANGGGVRRVSANNAPPSPTSWLPSPDASPNHKVASLSPSSLASASSLSGPRPAARWGHSATSIGNGRMVVYGGQADENDDGGGEETLGSLFLLDTATSSGGGIRWEEPVNCESVPRAWHTASYLPTKNLLVTFGGERTQPRANGSNGPPEVLDDIMVLDTEIFLWYKPAASGLPPAPRAGHSAALLGFASENNKDLLGSFGAELVVFGGTRGRKWEGSLHVLNCDRWEWSRPKVAGRAPSPRSYHSASSVQGGKLMVVFGGNDGDQCFNEVHVLSLSASATEGTGALGVASGIGALHWAWSQPFCVGEGPCARTGHASCCLSDGKTLLIHGGWDPTHDGESPQYFKDAFLLDTVTWVWTSIDLSALLLEQESSHLKELMSDGAAASSTDLLRNGLTGHTLELVVSSGSADSSCKLALFGGQVDGGSRQGKVALVGNPLNKKKQKKSSTTPNSSSSKPTSSSTSRPTPSSKSASMAAESVSSAAEPTSPAPAPLLPVAAPPMVDLKVGDVVEVAARTGPGQNKPGGVGRVMAVHSEGGDDDQGGRTYDIKYVLGGREKNVAESLLSPPKA